MKIATAIMAAAIAVALFAATPSTASAAAWNQGTVYLRNPEPPNFGEACVIKNIRLKRGKYRWKIYVVPRWRPDAAIASTRFMNLRAGTYQWQDCISTGYAHCSWLDELANGLGGAARECHWPPARFGDGYYHYGSGLEWVANF